MKISNENIIRISNENITRISNENIQLKCLMRISNEMSNENNNKNIQPEYQPKYTVRISQWEYPMRISQQENHNENIKTEIS